MGAGASRYSRAKLQLLVKKESILDVLFIELATLSCVRMSVFKVQCAPQARCPLIALRREATKGDA